VKWEQGHNEVYLTGLMIETTDQPGMLARLTEAITKVGSNITQIEADTHENGRASIGVVCQLKDRKHLDKLLREVRSIPGVLKVDRRTTDGGRMAVEALN
jgi:guanosine-3',5'-bis(diphosphate) 3'-pyrophosphohydrolase